MQTGVLVGLAALAILGVGVVGASGIMAPAEGMQGGMGDGMMGGGSGIHNGGMMGDWTTTAPTLYVWLKVLWNPEVEVDAVLDEMGRRLYGPAAGTARELLRLECDRWQTGAWSRVLPDQGRIPPALFRSCTSRLPSSK